MATEIQEQQEQQLQPDAQAVEEFAGRALTDVAGTMATLFCIVGDRLGLFAALDEGTATPAELAARAGVDERYALEWLRGLTAAGYLEQEDGRWALPPAHAPVLAREGGVAFLGGGYHELGGMLPALERVIESFRGGAASRRLPTPTMRTSAWPVSRRRGSTTACSRAGCRCCRSSATGSRAGSAGPMSAAAPVMP